MAKGSKMSELGARQHELMLTNGRQLAARICQAFPEFSSLIDNYEFDIEFEAESEGFESMTRMEYEGGRLNKVVLNRDAIERQYNRIGSDGVEFADIVKMYVGVGICTDLLFKWGISSWNQDEGVRTRLISLLGETKGLADSIGRLEGNENESNHFNKSIEQLLVEDKYYNAVLQINARRIAFGMVVLAEQMYDDNTSISIASAMRSDIRNIANNRAAEIALLGTAITGNHDQALLVAADNILGYQDLPFAIPAGKKEVEDFWSKLTDPREDFTPTQLLRLTGAEVIFDPNEADDNWFIKEY